jgi:hypothetical protein
MTEMYYKKLESCRESDYEPVESSDADLQARLFTHPTHGRPESMYSEYVRDQTDYAYGLRDEEQDQMYVAKVDPEAERMNAEFRHTVISLIHTLAAFYAIYLSFRCNNGFHLGSFVVAIFCPYIYIIYVFAVYNNMCRV